MQPAEDDVAVCRSALDRKLVSREAMVECLFELAEERRRGAARPLGVLLIERGLIAREDLDALLPARVSDAEIGKLLVAAGVVSKEEVDDCLQLQNRARVAGKAPLRLGELVVQYGLATEAQVTRALAYQQRLAFACRTCGARVQAAPPKPGMRYRCKCGGEMAAAAPAAPPAVPLRETRRAEREQVEIDRAMALYLRQKGLVRRDHLREFQRLQLEFGRFGLVVPLLELLRRAGVLAWQAMRQLETMDFAEIVKNPAWSKQEIPGYKLLQRVASGGFATIYAAEPLFGGPRVAVKILHPERAKDQRAVDRFVHEAKLLRSLSCDHIVRAVDAGTENGRPYLVMEYVDGRSLGQALYEGGAFPVRRALAATRQIAVALRCLHSEGYLHRDVKPDNALIDAQDRVKLCDLGFAAPIPGVALDGARAKTVVGTSGYLSPEVLRGEAGVKVGGDIYALGIVLYSLLTGHEPFSGASSEETVAGQLESGAPVPDLMLVQAPPGVIQFLKKLMHPDRERRFGSIPDVLTALTALETR